MPGSKQKFQWTFSKILAVVALAIVVGVLVYALIAARTGSDGNDNSSSAPSSGQQITVEGEYACLPKGDGPQTLECAFGIKADGGDKYYGLDFNDAGGSAALSQVKIGERGRVTGVFEEQESIYLSEGVITVESFE